MIAEERRNIILKNLKENNFFSVEELSQKMDVSHMTIRRDLETLSNSGLIERCFGGAFIKEEKQYFEKNITNSEAKERIAEKAASFISPNDVIFLDAGTTMLHLAKKLINRSDLTIITADIEISYLLKNAAPNLIVLGGVMQKETGSMIGSFAAETLNHINFNIAYVGAACIRRNSRSYLLVDQSKFYKSSLVRLNPLEDFTGTITDKSMNSEEVNLIQERDINIINA